MADNSKQIKGLVDLMAETQIKLDIGEYISTHLPKEKLIEIGTEIIIKHIIPLLKDNPNVFVELDKGAWAISYDNKYGLIVSKGKAPGFRYIAYLLQNAGEIFSPIQLEDQFKTMIHNKITAAHEYDEEKPDNIDSGIIDNKLSRETQKKLRGKYKEIIDDLRKYENFDDLDPEKRLLLKDIKEEKEKFEKTFLKTYKIPVFYLFGKYSEIPKDKSVKLESSKTQVARHIRKALDLIGKDPNISHLKDYLERAIDRGYNLKYKHDPTKPSWKVILK